MVAKYYEVLGIGENASKEEIKKTYRELVMKWHPDKFDQGKSSAKTKEEALKKMQEISEAYENLNNEGIRKVGYKSNYYDDELPKEGALIKETLKDLDDSYSVLRTFDTGEYNNSTGRHSRSGETAINDYDLERVKRILQLLNTISELNKEGREHESYHNDVRKMKSTRFKYISDLKEAARQSGQGFLFWWFDEATSWESNFNRVLRMLNRCRDKMGLKQLTDQDFWAIENNNQNENPQIPDGERPKPIENGVADINEYNRLWYEGKHSDIVKYQELRGEIFNTSEKVNKYSSANSTLYEEVKNKTVEGVEKTQFQKIWEKDEANKISEIKRFNENKLAEMKKASELMERLIAEGKKEKNSGSESQNSNVSEPKNNKRKAEEVEISERNNKKSKIISDNLDKLIHEAKDINDYEALEAKIKEIDKNQGEEKYKDRQNEINELKIRLGNLNKGKFKELSIKKIEEVMKVNNIKESDLSAEEKVELNKLKNENDVKKITELENKVSEKIGKKGALNTLKDWLKQAQELVEGVKKDTVEHLQAELKKVKEGLQNFRFSTNTYQQSVYKEKENDVKQMLEKLENHSFQNNNATKPTKSGFRPEIVIPVAFLAVVLVAGVIVVVARNRKQAKAKAK